MRLKSQILKSFQENFKKIICRLSNLTNTDEINKYHQSFYVLILIFFLSIKIGYTQCTTGTESGESFVLPTTDVTLIDVATPFFGEYVTFEVSSVGETYEFTPAFGYLTIADDATNTAIVFGTGTQTFIPSATGTYRLYAHLNSACGTTASGTFIDVTCITCPSVAALEVQESSTPVLNGQTIDLGEVTTSSSPITRTFIFSNVNGTADLNVSDISLGAGSATGFAISDAPTTPLVLNAGAFSFPMIDITFTPSTDGTFTGSLQITSDDPDDNPFIINFSVDVLDISSFDVIYSEDFDGETGPELPSGWTEDLSNGDGTNAWILGTGATELTNESIYISNDGGTNNSYDNTSSTITTAVTPSIDASGKSAVAVSFNYVVEGESDFDEGTLVYSTDGGSTFTTIPNTLFQGITTSKAITVILPAVAISSDLRIGFRWENDDSFGDNPSFSIDDIVVSATESKLDQSITFNLGENATKTIGDASFDLTATASSGLIVTYASSDASVATISGSTVTIVGLGTTTITASQAGNTIYNAASDVTQLLTVNASGGNSTGVVTSLEDIDSSSIILYPNPTKDILTVKGLIGQVNFSLIDNQGQEVLSGIGNDSFELNLSALPTGIYILGLENNGQSISQKLVKQ